MSVDGGITAPRGFRAAGVACGIKRKPGQGPAPLDLALIAADGPVAAAAVFTTNLAVAAPVLVSREHLARSGGLAKAIVVNSGCANACTGAAGLVVAREMAGATAAAVGCSSEQVLVASTGVIGVQLDENKIRAGVKDAAHALDAKGAANATRAIMTTDPFPKSTAIRVEGPGGTFTVGGMAKGSGMIEPRMATMLAFLTTDAKVEPDILGRALRRVVNETFNAITVDGECSTNDCVFLLASGASGVAIARDDDAAFVGGLREVAGRLAREIVRGGEGATKLVTVRVTGARSPADARLAARTIANSPLVKTAIHGGDPNWGRLVAAAGRSGADFVLDHATVSIAPGDFVPPDPLSASLAGTPMPRSAPPGRAAGAPGAVDLFVDGTPHDERSEQAADVLAGKEVTIVVDLGTGGAHSFTMWTCDFSADYVKINAEYRT